MGVGGNLQLLPFSATSLPPSVLQAQNVAKVLHDVRSGRPTREFVNQGIDDEDQWYKKLGGRLPVATHPAVDAPIPLGVKRLMRVSDSSGEMKMTEVRLWGGGGVKGEGCADAFP